MSDHQKWLRRAARQLDITNLPGWSSKLIEAADAFELLEAELADYKQEREIVLKDLGACDEVHCSCVPVLRMRIKELEEGTYSDSRERFEAWIKSKHPTVELDMREGSYLDPWAAIRWDSWSAGTNPLKTELAALQAMEPKT